MLKGSIFDCDKLGPSTANGNERTQVTYDEDLFSFDATPPSSNSIEKPVVIFNGFHQKTDTSKSEYGGKRKRYSEFKRPLATKIQRTIVNQPPAARTNSRCDPVGTIFDERNPATDYNLLHMIGQGTYGQVWKAKRKDSNTIIAVKQISIQTNKNTTMNMQFYEREKANLFKLRNIKNIMQILDEKKVRVAMHEIRIDLIFEYCPLDLLKIIKNRQILFQLAEVKTFMREILIGVHAMHKNKIMHRDIKSENILLTAQGVVKIGDFGLSREMADTANSISQQYTISVVTLYYRAPELLLGDRKYTSQVDMWSVGCVMGEFWKRQPIMLGANEFNQLQLISKLCGTINAINWPNVVTLSGFQNINIPGSYPRLTRSFLNNNAISQNEEANNFFDSLLIYDPENRLNATKALNQEFFYTHPLPLRNLRTFFRKILPLMNNKPH